MHKRSCKGGKYVPPVKMIRLKSGKKTVSLPYVWSLKNKGSVSSKDGYNVECSKDIQ